MVLQQLSIFLFFFGGGACILERISNNDIIEACLTNAKTQQYDTKTQNKYTTGQSYGITYADFVFREIERCLLLWVLSSISK